MAEIGTLVGQEIKENRDSDRKTRILKIQITDPEDIQSVEQMSSPGDDYKAPDDSQVLILTLGEAWRLAIAMNDGIEPAADLESGERELYSSDAGVRKAVIRLLKDGKVKINGGGKQVARKDDPTLIDGSTDPVFIAWMAAVAIATGVSPPPTTVTGKINAGSADVEVS